MTTYIAHFTASHQLIHTSQNSIFIWQQEGGEVDQELLSNKIKRESALHFYRLIAGPGLEITESQISVKILKTQPFDG